MLRHSLRDRLLLYVVSVLIFVGAALIVIVFFFSRDVVIKEKKADLRNIDLAYASGIQRQIDTAIGEAKDLASQQAVIAYIANSRREVQNPAILNILQGDNIADIYSALYILDAHGTAIVSTDPTFIGTDFSFRDYFKQASQGLSASEFAVGIISKRAGFYAAYPINSEGGVFAGVVVVKLKPETIASTLGSATTNAGGHMMLVDQDGIVLYADRPERDFMAIASLSEETRTRIQMTRRFADQSFRSLSYDPAAQIISAYTSPVTIELFDQTDKESEIVSVAKVEGTSFYLLNEFGLDELLVPINEMVFVISVSVLVLVILVGGGLVFLIRKTMQPLNDFQRIAKRMSHGDFSERAIVHSSDEIEELGVEFNAMAKELGQLYNNLDRKVAEQVRDLAKFRLAVESASDHIVITDPEGVILYANPAVTRITGYSREEVLGKKAGGRDLWGGMMPPELYKDMWRTIKTERKTFFGELLNRRKNGDVYEAMASITPIIEDGKIIFFLGMERDVSKDREVDRAKTEFVSLASHQLRTPLTAISWYAEILLDETNTNINPEQKDQLETILKSSHRMTDLVDTLLNISRLEMGTFTIDPGVVDVVVMANDVLEELQLDIAKKCLDIVKNVSQERVDMVADPKLLRIVFQNLLSNAVKYTQEGGTILVTIEQQEDEYLFSVSDTGFGIPKKDQPLIFNKLFRADNAKQQGVEGTGLGLYITKTIVEKSGGKIWFESEENKGTTFLITFPLTGMRAKEGTKMLE